MKLGVAGILASVLTFACCQPPECRRPPPPDPELPTEASKEQACEQAGTRLAALKCKEARADFKDFCLYELAHDVPLRPTCLAKITTCADVKACK